jgi:hypothetical protein
MRGLVERRRANHCRAGALFSACSGEVDTGSPQEHAPMNNGFQLPAEAQPP